MKKVGQKGYSTRLQAIEEFTSITKTVEEVGLVPVERLVDKQGARILGLFAQFLERIREPLKAVGEAGGIT